MSGEVLIILLAFQAKHLFCDFFLQRPRHYLVKGTYGKWGGIEHALIHAQQKVGGLNLQKNIGGHSALTSLCTK